MDPLPGSGIVQVDLNLVFSIIDRLLGGPGWFPNKLRDLTDIERTLMQRFMARMLNSYRESWNYLLTLSLKIEALDSNPQFIPRIIPLDQIVAYISMRTEDRRHGRRDELLPSVPRSCSRSGSSLPTSSGRRPSSPGAA